MIDNENLTMKLVERDDSMKNLTSEVVSLEEKCANKQETSKA